MFTMIQEAVSLDLEVELGHYTHISDSLHIYNNEIDKARALTGCSQKTSPMPPMSFSPITNNVVHTAEREIRSTHKGVKIGDEYWDQQLELLNIYE